MFLRHYHQQDPPGALLAVLADHANSFVVILFGCSVSAGPRDEFPRTPSFTLSLPADAGCADEEV